MNKKVLSVILSIALIFSTFSIVAFTVQSSSEKVVALTFDDGPNDSYYTQTLDLLWQYDALATFFVLGKNVEEYPDELNRTLDEGHEIGLHSYSHQVYTDYTIEQVNSDIDKCQSAIYNVTKTYAKILRLPSFSLPSYFVQRQIKYPLIGAKQTSAASILNNTINDGDILLIHNGVGSANVESDMANLEAVLQKLTDEGFEFVTVSELFERKGVTPTNGTRQYTNVSAASGSTAETVTTGACTDDGMLINFDDRPYAGYERQQDYTTTTTPANYTSYSVVEETYTNADGEQEKCSSSGNAFKIAFPSGQTAKYRNASISLKDLSASGISPEAQGISFWAKSISTTATLDYIGITMASKTLPSKRVANLEITTEGKYYYLPYSTLGVLSGDDLSRYKYLTIYTDLYDMNGKTIYIDDISLYGLGQPITTTEHITETYATETRTTTRPVCSDNTTARTTLATQENGTTTTTSATTTTTTTTVATSTASSAVSESGVLSLDSSQVKFANAKYFSGTNVAGDESSGYIAKMQGGMWNASDKFFGIKFDQSVFDLNPTKFEITLKTDGGDYTGKYSWFSTSDYTSLQASPAVQSTLPRVNTWSNTVSTAGTTLTFDLTTDSYKDIVTNKYNYFYLCPRVTNSSVENMYCVSFKVYYSVSSYNVTIDGETVECQSSSVTLPENAELYVANGNVYLAGETVEIESDMSFASYSLGLSMKSGASMRLNQVNGIRFYTNVNTKTIARLKDNGIEVQMGTLIAPVERATNGLTLDMSTDDYLDVKYESDEYYSEGDWSGIVGSIVNIKKANANLGFVGRGYVKVTSGGQTKIVYASYSGDAIENNTRTIGSLACSLKADDEAFGVLSVTHQAVVNKYYELYIEQ